MATFFGWSFLLYRINFEAAQSPLNLLSDILGQSPLRGFADRGGRSVRGRNGSRYEAKSLQGVGMERLPYNHTALIDVARQGQKGRARRRQRVQSGQYVVPPQESRK